MNISEVKMTDAEALLMFCRKLKTEGAEMTFAEADSIEAVELWIEDDHEHLFILRQANQIVALIKARQGRGSKTHSAFLSAAVLEARRGEGLVKTLSHEVYPVLKERGIQIARAYIYSNNHASISAVLKEGFHCSGTVLMHHFNEDNNMWVDDIIFHKFL